MGLYFASHIKRSLFQHSIVRRIDSKGGTDARSSVLHRINVKTGKLERMLDCAEDGYILTVHADDGRLFLHQRRAQNGANAEHTFWYLVQNDAGEWEKRSPFGESGE